MRDIMKFEDAPFRSGRRGSKYDELVEIIFALDNTEVLDEPLPGSVSQASFVQAVRRLVNDRGIRQGKRLATRTSSTPNHVCFFWKDD